jgi:hypothetical protein
MSIDLRIAIPGFHGDVLAPGDGGYDAARAVENAAIDRRPAAIARCSRPEDVAAVSPTRVTADSRCASAAAGTGATGSPSTTARW